MGSSLSVHGDYRRMLRIISRPLGKIRPRIVILITMETVVVDGVVIGWSGSHGAIQVLQGVSGMWYMQNEKTQATLGIQWLAHTKCPLSKYESVRQDCS